MPGMEYMPDVTNEGDRRIFQLHKETAIESALPEFLTE